jgi:hypothetical protein
MSGGMSVTITGNDAVSTCDGHTHDNKVVLDSLDTDDNGYLYSKYKETEADESSSHKIKAGYADEAGALADEDSFIEKLRQFFLSKTNEDVASGLITFIKGLRAIGGITAEGGVQFGESFAEGLTGYGGMIDANGNAWLRNLKLYESLEVPLLRYNKTEICNGNWWQAPGGGEIESVTPDTDNDGNTLLTGTITLRLEDGELGTIAEDDICMGIFHDSVALTNNEAADSDDGKGNFTFAGFYTCYFRITEVLDTATNSKFRYALRPKSSRWTTQHHPAASMNFVCYGNFTDTSRQESAYFTRTYERKLRGVNGWEITDANIAYQSGKLDGTTINGVDMTGYSAYLNNIYMSGTIEQFAALPLVMHIDISNDNFITWGETKHISCRVTRGFDDVTDQVTQWTVTRDSAIEQDDAAWALKDKVKNFAGEIDLCFTAEENDIGNNSNAISTVYSFTATIESGDTVTHELTI